MKIHSSDSGSGWRARLDTPPKRALAVGFVVILLLYSAGLLYLGALNRSELAEWGRNAAEAPAVLRNRLVAAFVANPPNLQIDVTHRNYQQLAFKREQAMELGRLIVTDDDYVPAEIRLGGQTMRVRIRLKGDWLDHLEGDTWSFRVDARGDNTVLGMERFSLQKPETRNYVNEWIFHQMLRTEGLIGLRYEFVRVILNGRDLGIYALEEHFDNRLIEHNARRAGPIVRFDETMLFADAYDPRTDDLEPHETSQGAGSYLASPVEGFRTARLLADSTTAPSYVAAVGLLEGFRSGELDADDVFDVDKMATFLAICDVGGAEHATFWHNFRFYLNPITARLEPIGFDAVAGIPIEELSLFLVGAGEGGFLQQMRSDPAVVSAYVAELERLSQRMWLEMFFESISDEMEDQLAILHLEWPRYRIPVQTYYENQDFVRRRLYPSAGLHAYVASFSGDSLELEIGNIQRLPLKLDAVVVGDTNALRIPVTFPLRGKRPSRIVDYRVLTLRLTAAGNKRGPADRPVYVKYHVPGSARAVQTAAFPYPRISEPIVADDVVSDLDELGELGFLVVDRARHSITVEPGEWVLDRKIHLPEGYSLLAGPGTRVDLREQAFIVSESRVRFTGTADEPVVIESTDGTGLGLAVVNADSLSLLEHVQLRNLASLQGGARSLTGALTFYQSPALIVNAVISGSRAEDAVNIVRSDFNLENVTITGSKSDALDVDFASGVIRASRFVDSGNDGIDVSGSVVILENVESIRSGDKGLSVGETSEVTASRLDIRDAYVGVAVKDLSMLELSTGSIASSHVGLAVFQKKSEFGAATLHADNVELQDVARPFLVETRSALTLDGETVDTFADSVAATLYPNQTSND